MINVASKNGWVTFWFDPDEWCFPLSFHYSMVGNRHRPWAFRIDFLCFTLILNIHEDLRETGCLYQQGR